MKTKLVIQVLAGVFLSGAAAMVMAQAQPKSEFERSLPRVERGELKNGPPVVVREPTPIERGIKQVIEAPVRPTVILSPTGPVPGVQYQHKLP